MSTGDLGLKAVDLDLAGAFFLGFALMQLVLGRALDHYGPRRVQMLMHSGARSWCVGFALSSGLADLFGARLFIGMDVSGRWMSPLTSYRGLFAPEPAGSLARPRRSFLHQPGGAVRVSGLGCGEVAFHRGRRVCPAPDRLGLPASLIMLRISVWRGDNAGALSWHHGAYSRRLYRSANPPCDMPSRLISAAFVAAGYSHAAAFRTAIGLFGLCCAASYAWFVAALASNADNRLAYDPP